MFQKENNEKDIALALAWQKGNTNALEELLLKYMPLIMKASIHHYDSSDWEDMRQNLIVKFIESTNAYKAEMKVPFSAYIKKKILWSRANVLKKIQDIASHESLTIDEIDEPYYEIQMNHLSTKMVNDIAEIAQLTRKQCLIYPLWLQGKSIKEIHTCTGMSERSIQRLLDRLQEALHVHAKPIATYLRENY